MIFICSVDFWSEYLSFVSIHGVSRKAVSAVGPDCYHIHLITTFSLVTETIRKPEVEQCGR